MMMGRCFLFLMLAADVFAQIDSGSALFQLIEAERNFAKMSVSTGMKNAFANNVADDGIIFRPGPVPGKPVWEKAKPLPYVLKWEPEFAEVSQSGDFGYTTGPYEVQSFHPLTNPLEYGYFTSVWRKSAGGTWKVELDLGISCPPMGAREIRVVPPADSPQKTVRKSNELRTMDSIFSVDYASRKDMSFIERIAASVRLHREGKLPITNAESVKAFIKSESLPAWRVMGSGIAPSGELGYTYGGFPIKDEIKGYYLRIWKWTGSNWQIVLDLNNIPPPDKPADSSE